MHETPNLFSYIDMGIINGVSPFGYKQSTIMSQYLYQEGPLLDFHAYKKLHKGCCHLMV